MTIKSPNEQDAKLQFGHFEIQRVERQLLVAGKPAALGSRAFDLLLALCERSDHVVPKNELIELVWPGLVVEENNLQVQISSLRKLLGREVIATIPGRGYQFTVAPTAATDANAQSHPALTPSLPVANIATALPAARLPGNCGRRDKHGATISIAGNDAGICA